MEEIILASASPRRQELLKQIALPFLTMPQDVDESFSGNPPVEEALLLAEKKVKSCVEMLNKISAPCRWVLGADTFIEHENILIGKPKNRGEAFKMLEAFSGSVHTVITGLALQLPAGNIVSTSCSTKVEFSRMSTQDIEWYLDTEEWQGVAGSYRIQGRGAVFIKRLTGSYSNVMGLPINTFYGILSANNYNFHD